MEDDAFSVFYFSTGNPLILDYYGKKMAIYIEYDNKKQILINATMKLHQKNSDGKLTIKIKKCILNLKIIAT